MMDYISSVCWWTILSNILFKVFHWYSCVTFLSDFLFAALIILDALGMNTLFQKANINNFPSIPCIISLNSGVTVHSYMVTRSSGLCCGCLRRCFELKFCSWWSSGPEGSAVTVKRLASPRWHLLLGQWMLFCWGALISFDPRAVRRDFVYNLQT